MIGVQIGKECIVRNKTRTIDAKSYFVDSTKDFAQDLAIVGYL